MQNSNLTANTEAIMSALMSALIKERGDYYIELIEEANEVIEQIKPQETQIILAELDACLELMGTKYKYSETDFERVCGLITKLRSVATELEGQL